MELSFHLLQAPFQDPSLDLTRVPSCYAALREVFSKARAASLPPYRPYDCTTDLLPGMSPPQGRLYSLSAPEMKAMKEYINSALAAGIICPSSSPAGSGFFFVEKKDKTFRPCTDFCGLNNSSPCPRGQFLTTDFTLVLSSAENYHRLSKAALEE